MNEHEPSGPDSILLPNDDGDADREDAAFARGEAYERRAAERHRAKLIEKRHELANKATVARLQADEMFLEIKKLDAEIKELGHE